MAIVIIIIILPKKWALWSNGRRFPFNLSSSVAWTWTTQMIANRSSERFGYPLKFDLPCLSGCIGLGFEASTPSSSFWSGVVILPLSVSKLALLDGSFGPPFLSWLRLSLSMTFCLAVSTWQAKVARFPPESFGTCDTRRLALMPCSSCRGKGDGLRAIVDPGCLGT